MMAERVGFEPTVPLWGTRALQARAFSRSAISPRSRGAVLLAERGDSNPRYGFWPYNGLANRRLQPLGHLSTRAERYPVPRACARQPRRAVASAQPEGPPGADDRSPRRRGRAPRAVGRGRREGRLAFAIRLAAPLAARAGRPRVRASPMCRMQWSFKGPIRTRRPGDSVGPVTQCRPAASDTRSRGEGRIPGWDGALRAPEVDAQRHEHWAAALRPSLQWLRRRSDYHGVPFNGPQLVAAPRRPHIHAARLLEHAQAEVGGASRHR